MVFKCLSWSAIFSQKKILYRLKYLKGYIVVKRPCNHCGILQKTKHYLEKLSLLWSRCSGHVIGTICNDSLRFCNICNDSSMSQSAIFSPKMFRGYMVTYSDNLTINRFLQKLQWFFTKICLKKPVVVVITGKRSTSSYGKLQAGTVKWSRSC